mgnify:CR=1 FL=1
MESGGGGCLFGVEVCDGEAVVDGVGGFGEDCGEKAYWDSEGGVGPREFGDGLAGFEDEGGRGGAEEDL